MVNVVAEREDPHPLLQPQGRRGEETLAFEAVELPVLSGMPHITAAHAPVLRRIAIVDECGEARDIDIPAERPLTVFVDKRELVTLMTLGASPELLVLGYLLNQSLVEHPGELAAIEVDWEVDAAAVKTRRAISKFAARTARRVVTTGCGQGTAFGDSMDQIAKLRLPPPDTSRFTRATLTHILDQMRQRQSVHRQAGSVHGCALYHGDRLLVFVEDVGRHNALDTIAGWMALHGVAGADKIFYTTGRLTSEMVMKAAKMGVPIVASRNGVTAMGHSMAMQLGMTLLGRAGSHRFLCFCGFERLEPSPQKHEDAGAAEFGDTFDEIPAG